MIARGDLKRCLIVAPGSSVEQWQDELYQKFHLRFDILTNDRMESVVSGNVFTEVNYWFANSVRSVSANNANKTIAKVLVTGVEKKLIKDA